IGLSAGLRRWGARGFVALALATFLVRPLVYFVGTDAVRPLALVLLAWMGLALGGFGSLAALDALRWVAGRLLRGPPVSPAVSEARRRFLSRAVAGTSVVVSGIALGYGARRALGSP